MNMDLQGFLDYFERKNASGIIVSDNGNYLSDIEAKAFVMCGIENDYKELKDMPEFEDVKERIALP